MSEKGSDTTCKEKTPIVDVVAGPGLASEGPPEKASLEGQNEEVVSAPTTVLEKTGLSGATMEDEPAAAVVEKLCQECGVVCAARKRCKKCKSGCYCSRLCRKKHPMVHKELCDYIQELEQIERCKQQVFSVRESSQVKVKNRLVRLIGERPTLDFWLNDPGTVGYWGNGEHCM